METGKIATALHYTHTLLNVANIGLEKTRAACSIRVVEQTSQHTSQHINCVMNLAPYEVGYFRVSYFFYMHVTMSLRNCICVVHPELTLTPTLSNIHNNSYIAM